MEQNKNNDKRICRAAISIPLENEDFDFEAVAVPAENGQLNYNWEKQEYFNQVLRTQQENINTDRLDSGLPLFDNHPWDSSAMNTLGITTAYEFTEKGLVVRCKFGNRADEALRKDVKDGIVKTVSIEGTINEYEITRPIGEIPIYYAKRWTPESLSFAPVPNDIGAQIEVKRAIQKQIEKNPELQENKYKQLTNKF